MIRIREAIIVEGRYDKNTLAQAAHLCAVVEHFRFLFSFCFCHSVSSREMHRDVAHLIGAVDRYVVRLQRSSVSLVG